MTGVRMQQVPYKSGGPAIVDLLGGHVQLYFAVPISIMPHIKSGKVRPIAVTGKSRLVALPQVPTFAEAGLPGFDVKYWYGILGPAGMPKDIVDKYSTRSPGSCRRRRRGRNWSGRAWTRLSRRPTKWSR